ncbi:hypothetical protein HAX54_052796, partial [Datura stramonium]|nr:hypothetical protein [Datura stramonium]
VVVGFGLIWAGVAYDLNGVGLFALERRCSSRHCWFSLIWTALYDAYVVGLVCFGRALYDRRCWFGLIWTPLLLFVLLEFDCGIWSCVGETSIGNLGLLCFGNRRHHRYDAFGGLVFQFCLVTAS